MAIVPAAGKAERFGSAKLLAEIDGEPLIVHTVRSLQSGGVTTVIVVVAPGSPLLDLQVGLRAPAVLLAINPDPERGMFSSIQAGVAAGAGCPGVMLVHPADMPFVQPATVAAVLAASADDAVILPTCNGRHGHPIALPGRLREPLLAADPCATLKAVLDGLGLDYRELDVADSGVLRDVDVPRDLPRSG